ncbi:hypothetical protein E2C01_043995 [Portunus trituberculatus]|uniref:Uncharacterized protein n=1 Tax=Portunus trituberculatus TaxID=210409 RepID=A0A5B7FUE1_PORTR|nr:hypothetical protein [Portunus trituberculatus]
MTSTLPSSMCLFILVFVSVWPNFITVTTTTTTTTTITMQCTTRSAITIKRCYQLKHNYTNRLGNPRKKNYATIFTNNNLFFFSSFSF